jgi:uncharacterized membrane protein YkvA (DUF1232 family)
MSWPLIALAVMAGAWLALVAGLALTGRREHAVAAARFVPDCAVLFRRLIRDPAVPRRHKLLLVATVGYLASPVDLVPDVIPVVGALDDALVVALVLRRVLRRAGAERLAEHWPGPPASLAAVRRLAGA